MFHRNINTIKYLNKPQTFRESESDIITLECFLKHSNVIEYNRIKHDNSLPLR